MAALARRIAPMSTAPRLTVQIPPKEDARKEKDSDDVAAKSLSPLEKTPSRRAAKAAEKDSLRELAEARRRMETGEDQPVTV